jgi:2-dehydro-3-deoxyphosphogalactonate aldolase
LILPADAPPIVAILRGVRPGEVVDIAGALYDAGVRIIETPLNSPDPFDSIKRLAKAFGNRCLCGAGTVLSAAHVDRVHAAGGKLIVTPDTNPLVIERAVALGMVILPGFATATEAFRALQAGAQHLKLFPAATYGPRHLKALKTVLPSETAILAVGGIGITNLGVWLEGGAAGFGVGGELYRPGDKPRQVHDRASALMTAFADAQGSATRSTRLDPY